MPARTGQRTGEYPGRPICVVVPFTPGGQPDIVARQVAAAMELARKTGIKPE